MRYFIFLFSLFYYSHSNAQQAVWLLVDTQAKVIEVKQGEQIVATFEQISIGRRGAGLKQKRGDGITPLGTYKITHTNPKSRYKTFFGLNYPSAEDANLALLDARISHKTYQRIVAAQQQNRIPPQSTALGGSIGIHGLGKGNKQVHSLFDWTRGCIALTNKQISSLEKWIYKGMLVKIE
ncbi:MAG: L,D-transpeptidase family protein [Methyloprofundus sp.]|nr:L,D-transpeptidase family protein [Methyloprofundus sp.]